MVRTWRAAALYALLTLVLAYPLSMQANRVVLSDDPDTHLFIWTLAWDVHAFTHQPLSLFDANIFHPLRLTLAYSENLIGSALLAAPVIWLTSNPVLAMNVVALLACVLCGVGAYVLGRRLGLGQPGALLCGLIFAFAPPRFFRTSQIFLATIQWIPFTLASLHSYLETGRKRDLRLAIAYLSLQALTSGHGVVFLAVAVAVLLSYRVVLGEPIDVRRRLHDLGVTGVLLLAPAILVFVPYAIVRRELGLRSGLHYAETAPSSFFASPTPVHVFLRSLVTDIDINAMASAFLFPGYLPVILALVAVIWGRTRLPPRARPPQWPVWSRTALALEVVAIAGAAAGAAIALTGPLRLRIGDDILMRARDPWRAWAVCLAIVIARIAIARQVPFDLFGRLGRWRAAFAEWAAVRRRDPVGLYAVLTVVCVLLALESPVSLWPYVNALPGFSFIRVPSRFMELGLLAIAVLAGFGFERCTVSLASRARQAAAVAIGAGLVLEFIAVPLQVTPYRVIVPQADLWVSRQEKPFSVAEVPVTLSIRTHTNYMLHSMAHWQKTVHGYSGIVPALHATLYDELRTFPDEQSIRHLQQLAVRYVLVHTQWYSPEDRQALEKGLRDFSQVLKLEYSDPDGRVYSLRR